MKLLVTGGCGFIGSNFIRTMMQNHPEVEITNLDLLTYAGNPENLRDVESSPRYRFVKGDIRDAGVVRPLVAAADVIVNFAAESHVDRSVHFAGDFVSTDVYGTYVLLEAVRACGTVKRYLQISTDEVYGDLDDGSFAKETDPLRPSSPYAASKAGGDLLVLAYRRTHGLPVTISRCTNNYGPYHHPEKIIPLFITNAIDGKQLPLYDGGGNVRDWLYVEDHCRALETIIERGRDGEIYNIGANSAPEITNRMLTEKILDILGAPRTLIADVHGLRPGHDRRYAVDTAKIRGLGWSPSVDIDEGLRRTVEWYRSRRDWWEPTKSGAFREFYEQHYRMTL